MVGKEGRRRLFLRSLPLDCATAYRAPQDACSGITTHAAAGAVLLATRSGCLPSQKLANAQAAGAVGLLLTDDRTDGFFAMGSSSGISYSTPLMGVPLSTGRDLWSAVQVREKNRRGRGRAEGCGARERGRERRAEGCHERDRC